MAATTSTNIHSDTHLVQQQPRHGRGAHKQRTSIKYRSSFFSSKQRSHLDENARRDSGLASSFTSTIETPPFQTTVSDVKDVTRAAMAQPQHDIPSIVVHDEHERVQTPPARRTPSTSALDAPQGSGSIDSSVAQARAEAAAQLEQPAEFRGITIPIPTGVLDDPFSSEELSFSKRGSVLWSGEKTDTALSGGDEMLGSRSVHSMLNTSSHDRSTPDLYANRAMSSEEVRMSQRVRSMYDYGDENAGVDWMVNIVPPKAEEESVSSLPAEPLTEEDRPKTGVESLYAGSVAGTRANSLLSSRRSSVIRKEPWEAAGGIEDWRDVQGEDVDRYGFIKPRPRVASGSSSVNSTSNGPGSPEASYRTGHRSNNSALATVDESAANDPPSRDGSVQHVRSPNGELAVRSPPRPNTLVKRSSPSVRSFRSRRSSMSTSVFRRSADVNRGRRWADAAGDMLSMEPGQSILPFETEDSSSPAKAAKEREREAKWAKMARAVSTSTARPTKGIPTVGGGQEFTFDNTSPKLISRTWKGIPDRWRASAWYSFLTTSAMRQASLSPSGQPFVPDSKLIEAFHNLQDVPCVDDPQIDMDVPRTIGGHIMFRRRYRGGQRLMFRVLRALALYFPETGYVQGMAPLAATLLCYYDEERAFVMAARMWTCRGLAALYAPGFAGLMHALDGFERDGWLGAVGNGAVGKCLEDVGVVTGSYGTKWYLTLFAYSIPFAAQLRVWDVFMLLGGMQLPSSAAALAGSTAGVPSKQHDLEPDLDVLHAVSAALLDGLQDVLLDADFENAMKVLTSPVPVGREDVLMDVARREYVGVRAKLSKKR